MKNNEYSKNSKEGDNCTGCGGCSAKEIAAFEAALATGVGKTTAYAIAFDKGSDNKTDKK